MLKPIRIGFFHAAVLLSLVSAAPAVFAASPTIYSETADAHADLKAALTKAAHGHKRVILDFGGNWCGDCQVLDLYFHDPANAALLERSFVLVHVNIGRYDRNLDLAKRYQVPLEKGVPALAILDSRGRLLYSQRQGEFEAMRRMDVSAVTTFLNQWKAPLSRAQREGSPCGVKSASAPC